MLTEDLRHKILDMRLERSCVLHYINYNVNQKSSEHQVQAYSLPDTRYQILKNYFKIL